MKITLYQDSIIWADPIANLQRVERHLHTLIGQTDLIVLPEMFSTGFCIDRPELAEPMNGHTLRSLCRWATDYGMAFTGSVMIAEGGKLYNRAFFVHPTGEIETADKRHLFTPGGEDNLFTPGTRRLEVGHAGMNICVLVCYDLRFPVWSRNIDRGYDLLIYVANWPAVRQQAWNVLLTARAIENQAYVCGVNRTGTDNAGLIYSGGSRVVDARGGMLFDAATDNTSVNTVTLSKETLDAFRRKFPTWQDADHFSL